MNSQYAIQASVPFTNKSRRWNSIPASILSTFLREIHQIEYRIGHWNADACHQKMIHSYLEWKFSFFLASTNW